LYPYGRVLDYRIRHAFAEATEAADTIWHQVNDKGETTYGFIERLFNISPDGGSGSTEAMYVLALFTIMLGMVSRRLADPQNQLP
jgi:hypothetical protein